MFRKDEPSTEEILSKLIWIESAMKKKQPKTNEKEQVTTSNDENSGTKEARDEDQIRDLLPKSGNSNALSSSVYRTEVEKYPGEKTVDKPFPNVYNENKSIRSGAKHDVNWDDENPLPVYDNNGTRQNRDERVSYGSAAYREGSNRGYPNRNDEQSSVAKDYNSGSTAKENPSPDVGRPPYKAYNNRNRDKQQEEDDGRKDGRMSARSYGGQRRNGEKPVKETKFQMIRNADSPCTDDLVSLAKLIKFTKRLRFTLYELREEVSGHREYQKNVNDLIGKVEWFLKDLDQSNGSCEQTFILLEKYDVYRSAYYCLRNKVDTIQLTGGRDGNTSSKYYNRETGDEDNEREEDDVNDYKADNMMGNGENRSMRNRKNKYRGNGEDYATNCRLYECPGLIDVRKGSDDRRYRYGEDSPKYLSLCDTLKKYCCMCFPCARKQFYSFV